MMTLPGKGTFRLALVIPLKNGIHAESICLGKGTFPLALVIPLKNGIHAESRVPCDTLSMDPSLRQRLILLPA
jgi:hypothetical protein